MQLSYRILAFGLIMLSSSVQAGICELKVKRVACAGKDAESYKKCDGKAECSSKKKAETEADCLKIAEEECINTRLDITKSKEITATFDGKGVKGGANLCAADRADYNKCK